MKKNNLINEKKQICMDQAKLEIQKKRIIIRKIEFSKNEK